MRMPPGPGGHDYKTRLQELAARRFDQLPRYQVRDEGPDHSKQFFATVPCAARSTAGERALEEARPSRPLPTTAWERLEPRQRAAVVVTARSPVVEHQDAGACLKSRSCAATSSERSSASGSRPWRSTAMRSVRRHHNRKQFISRLEGKKITGVDRRGKYLLCRLDGGDVLVIHLGMSGQLCEQDLARGTAEAHPRRDHVHPGRPAALRRSADVRRDVRHRDSTS